MFGKSPAVDYLGILDPSVVLAVDLAAAGVLREREREAVAYEEYRASCRSRYLAHMVGLVFAGEALPPLHPPGEGPEASEARPATVTIIVDGERRTVPAPKPGEFYNASGELIDGRRNRAPKLSREPQGVPAVRRF